ncbi:TIGR04255 family protein [Helicobacter sp.]|uniref:TIGR04255 family protein n=1 Tax=Helicobacter sp. TaxID=218 RepID=UPI0019A8E298|nr:TIGR04255 family protein [Helicobacter sp.]MBD5165219.1 TIGR04255 family protein [Helicobacter sp.]
MNNSTNSIIKCICDLSLKFKGDIENLLPIIISSEYAFSDIERLPANQIPLNIRSIEPSLKMQPIYKIHSKEHNVEIMLGDFTIGFTTTSYKNWEDFNKIQTAIIKTIIEKDVIEKINRIGLRYINFFNGNIKEKGKDTFSFKINNEEKLENLLNVCFREEVKGNVVNTIIANKQTQMLEKVAQEGYITDIIVAFENNTKMDYNEIANKIEELHTIQEEQFESIRGKNV